MSITLEIDQVSRRSSALSKVLAPLSPRSPVPVSPVSATTVVSLVAGKSVVSSSPLRRHRFATGNPGILGAFLEEWSVVKGSAVLQLRSVSIHLYLKTRSDEGQPPVELIALHCEPTLLGGGSKTESERRIMYKRGPHWHFSNSPETLVQKAHVLAPLSIGHQCLSSLDALTDAISDAVRILTDEIIK